MFYRQESNQYITEGMPFTIDDIQYPSNWLNLTTPEEKEALGLVEVVTVGERKDDRYYWNSEVLEGATLTITNLPKDLDPVKEFVISDLKRTAYSLLFPSDWMVVRATETETPMDENWKNYRQEIRDKTTQYINDVEAAADVDTIAGMQFVWPEDPTV